MLDPPLETKTPRELEVLKTWTTVEIPCRAPPLTLQVLDALCSFDSVSQHA